MKTNSMSTVEDYQLLVENLNDGVIRVDINEKIAFVNKQFCKIVGYSKKELLGQVAFEILLNDIGSIKAVKKAIKERKAGIKSKYNLQVSTKSGKTKWINMNGTPLYDEKGKVVGSMGIVTDITEQVNDKQALVESEERYRTLNETAFDGIIVANSRGNIISWNKGAEIIFKYTEKEIVGEPLTTIIPMDYQKGYLEGFNRHSTTVKSRYIGQVIELEGKRKTGEIFPIEINLCSWETKSGKYLSGIIRDISKRKQIEQQIIDLKEELEVRVDKRTVELEKANDEIRVLLKEMHHRVKNNLQIVSSLLKLQAGTTDEKVARIFQDCQDRIQAMAFIHENLYLKESLSEISIKEYIEPLVKDRIRANTKLRDKIKLRIKLPDVKFNIDTMLPIGLLLNELVTNTLKHAYPNQEVGIIKLNIKIRKGNQAELNYSDDGVGFLREKVRDNPNALGLVLIDSFVMQIDGSMEVNSTKGGTHYTIKFEIPS
ncbi:MAG TPA: PAS domain S-box protein [Flavobacteriales bacterium]|nr:PAS domain S-box protein [Flavobacteriales bacterium]HIO72606.1 PAS domain S-box protein [Flavobacteriales bacterium]